MLPQSFTGLPISIRHARRASLMSGEHREPFDRMLIAQSLMDELTLISNERLPDDFGVERL